MDLSNIPVLRDINFSDPDKRKTSIKICCAGAAVVLVIIAIFVRKNIDKANADTQLVAESQYESLEIPLGKSQETISGKTITDISAKRRPEGGFAKDYEASEEPKEDPLAELTGEKKPSSTVTSVPVVDVPEFMKPGGNKDVYPEKQPSGSRAPAAKPGAAASAATGYQPGSTSSNSDKSFEEKRREAYLRNNIDPDTGEAIVGTSTAFRANQSSSASSQASRASSQNASAGSSTTSYDVDEQEEPEQPIVRVRRSGGVSTFSSGSSPSGIPLSSLSESDDYVNMDPSHPFKVKFAYNEKVSSGQRVTIRLCEDMVVDGVLIPENTHLFATCQVGERLKLQVSSINIGGKIYKINYVAYDKDGGEGLYCPQSDASRTMNEVGDQAEQLASSALQSAITGYPGRILQAGTSIFRSKKGKTTVAVTAGYQFYLMLND